MTRGGTRHRLPQRMTDTRDVSVASFRLRRAALEVRKMKTGKELKTMWVRFHGDIDQSWQAIADAWNESHRECEQAAKESRERDKKAHLALHRARKQLRKVQQELKDLSAAYDQECAVSFRMEMLAERIAKGTR